MNASEAPPAFGRDSHEINTFYFYETEQFTLLWTLLALIVVGNSAVLAALLCNHKGRKSRMNFFIVHLALADLSVGLISVLTDIVWRITVAWNAGNAACKLVRFLQALVTYSSTYVLVALSIDRYDAITRPMRFSGSWRRARMLVALAWTLSVIFSLPIVLLYHEKSAAVLDRVRRAVAVAVVHERRGRDAVRRAGARHRRLLRRHRRHHLAPGAHPPTTPQRAEVGVGGRGGGGGGARQPARQFAGHHPAGQDQKRQDDARHRRSVHRVLESVHRVRPAAGVRAGAAHADQPGARHLHPVAGAAQLGRQPPHLLPLLQRRRQTKTTEVTAGEQGAGDGDGGGGRGGRQTLALHSEIDIMRSSVIVQCALFF